MEVGNTALAPKERLFLFGEGETYAGFFPAAGPS